MQHKNVILWGLLGAVVIASTGFAGGYAVGAGNPDGVPVQDVANATVPSDINAGDFGLFWKTWRLIDAASYKASEDSAQDRVYGAIKGLVDSLGDPYSVFFTPEENRRFAESVQGSFGGVGIELGIRDKILTVIAPLKNTPADRAGIKAGEYILEINGSSTLGISIDQAINQIRGNDGTKVTLRLGTKEGEERSVELVRQRIEIPSLEVKMEGTIAHIALYEFTADAGAKFGEAVRALPKDTTGVVLDLRNNPGGFLEVAVDIAGWFVPRGSTIVKEAERDGNVITFTAKGPSTLENMPVVVLVNGGSASAAEILAGALKDLRRTPLVGETTFGKGTVQEVRDLPGGNGASVKLTVAEWLTPNGSRINKVGIEPDVKVEPDANASSTKDVQLLKALEVVRQQYSR